MDFNILMKNAPPWVDYKDNKTYLDLFRKQLIDQIKYSIIAIDYIENSRDKFTHKLFFGIQGLLCSLANISKLLDDTRSIRNAKDERARIRATRLLNDFDIDKSRIHLILNRNLRNTNEHYDERLDEFVEKFSNHLYLDGISAPGIQVIGHPYELGRFYNNKTKIIQFMDAQIKNIDELHIDKVKAELQYLEGKLLL